MAPKPAPRTVHLVCNAHLDPAWQWTWDEGAAEALSTFRVAADFCDEFPGFVFNHNEALLYQYVEEYDAALFRRIQALVRAGRWHIAGGWFLQPDCNMPSGESLVRQVLTGKRYFRAKFGVEPTTAYNFDSFGHARGLVQILARSGYDSYVHCRPTAGEMLRPLPARAYRWVGYDGSEIVAQHTYGWYCTDTGQAGQRLDQVLKDAAGDGLPAVLVLWGVGDHGGGPSRADLRLLARLQDQRRDVRIVHSTPEAYFAALRPNRARLPTVAHDLQRCFPGCYTSQARLKTLHRRLENELATAERLAAQAWAQNRMPYPAAELAAAQRELLFCQFHDILAGTCVQSAEDMALHQLGLGITLAERVRTRALFALSRGLRPPRPGTIPMLALNPHAAPLSSVFACDMSLADIHWEPGFWTPEVRLNGRPVPCQCEQEEGNVNIEWRKRVVVSATLPPSRLTRFDVRFVKIDAKPAPALQPRGGALHFANGTFALRLSTATGLVDSLRLGRTELAGPRAFRIVCLEDNDDPWGTHQHRLRTPRGEFTLVSPERARALCGAAGTRLAPVTVTEDGPVRTVIEVVQEYHDSHAVIRYLLPKAGAWFDVELRLVNAEKAAMLKLAVPLAFPAARAVAQAVFGREERALDGSEHVMQRWVAALPAAHTDAGLAVLNAGTYAFDATADELRLNLLRSPMYAFLPVRTGDAPEPGMFHARCDQGERLFRFRVWLAPAAAILERVDREAQAFNEPPVLLSSFAGGTGPGPARPLLELDDPAILCVAAKRAEPGRGLVLRLLEPTGQPRHATLRILGRWRRRLSFGPFEVKTLLVDPRTGRMRETDLLERCARRNPGPE